MKKLILFISILIINTAFSQNTQLVYLNSMSFESVDSLVSPYLCTVDTSGNLWVASTNSASATAIHGLFEAAPGDSSLHLVVAFADSDSVRNVTGITSIGNDIFVSARMLPYQGAQTPTYYPYSEIIYLPDGNAEQRIIFKRPNYQNYGTWYTGITADKDGYFYFGQSYLVTIGTIDGRKSSPNFGFTVNYAGAGVTSTPLEPGGGLTYPNVVDQIRDIAVDPKEDFSDTSSVVYTSRNSSPDPGGSGKGGIAVWTGGTESNPLGYHAKRVNDLSSFLTMGTTIPYGITVNPKNGYLYVCGTDTTKKWVKGFQVSGNFAVQTDELPSSTSEDVQDPNGAPFIAPADVAFNKDGSIAYVIDEGAKKVFKFGKKPTGVLTGQNQVINSFELLQNYPNPFNPETNIVVKISSPSKVKAEVYNIYGQVVSVLANGYVSAGTHIYKFSGVNLASGIYICKVSAGKNSRAIKMILLK